LQIYVLQIAFFHFTAIFLLQFITKQNLGMFLSKFAYYGLVFQICFLTFIFNLPAGFFFVQFSF